MSLEIVDDLPRGSDCRQEMNEQCHHEVFSGFRASGAAGGLWRSGCLRVTGMLSGYVDSPCIWSEFGRSAERPV
jgi:hypothetical protein